MQSLSHLTRHGACTSKQPFTPLCRKKASLLSRLSAPATSRCLHTISRRTTAASFNRPKWLSGSLAQPLRLPLSRFLTTKPLPSHKGPVVRFLYRAFAFTGLFIVACGSFVVAFFIYDASTYRE